MTFSRDRCSVNSPQRSSLCLPLEWTESVGAGDVFQTQRLGFWCQMRKLKLNAAVTCGKVLLIFCLHFPFSSVALSDMHTDTEVHKTRHRVVSKELLDSEGQGYDLSNIGSFSPRHPGRKNHQRPPEEVWNYQTRNYGRTQKKLTHLQLKKLWNQTILSSAQTQEHKTHKTCLTHLTKHVKLLVHQCVIPSYHNLLCTTQKNALVSCLRISN